MYVKLNLFISRDLSSKHSLALYEILKDYEKLEELRIEIDDFRRLIGLKSGQYKIFTMLRERVIDVAVKEINQKTDLKVRYTLEKQGRKIVAICFKIENQSSDEEQQNSLLNKENSLIRQLSR